jgi:hypothetical protein
MEPTHAARNMLRREITEGIAIGLLQSSFVVHGRLFGDEHGFRG